MYIVSKKKRFYCWLLNILFFLIAMPVELFRRKKTRRTIETSPSFLIVRLDHIGDVILATPLFHSLKIRFPAAKVSVLCGSWAIDVLKYNPYVDEVLTLDCPWWVSQRKGVKKEVNFVAKLVKFIRFLAKEKFDVFIDLRGDIRHFFLFGWLPGIPIRMSNNRAGGGFLLTDQRVFEPYMHEIDKNYLLLAQFEPIIKFDKPEIFGDKQTLLSLREKIPGWKPSTASPYVVLFNGGRSPLRRIDITKIVELCRVLISKYAIQCFLVGGDDDVAAGQEISDKIGFAQGYKSYCGRLTLLETMELIRQAVCFIGIDSSVLHLAAASGAPIIALYGPMHPRENRPRGDRVQITYHEYPCSPCKQTVCVQNRSRVHGRCMTDIEVAEILAKMDMMLVPMPLAGQKS